MSTVGESIVKSLADFGVVSAWGVVGDALNPITDAMRVDGRIEWIGVRHEEAGAFAAGAQAQLTDHLGLCMGTVGPGAVHLLNGLYDAKKSHAPVLAIVGQVPTPEIGSDYFQEVNNDVLFADVSVFCQTVTSAQQMPQLLEQAVNAAIAEQGVAVLTVPGDIGGLELPKDAREPFFAPLQAQAAAPDDQITEAAAALECADKVTLLVGKGAQGSRDKVLELAERLNAPMVLTLKAKEELERDNRFQVGQSGLIGNPAAASALEDADLVFMIGTDFPYREWYPTSPTYLQLDMRAAHIGRRAQVSHALVGHVGPTLIKLLPQLSDTTDTHHLDKATSHYERWTDGQAKLAEPGFNSSIVGKIRGLVDDSEGLIRPEAVAAALDEFADDDAIFTSDTGMSTVWLSRFITFSGSRRLLGSYNLGSMANAMPQALGAQALDRKRQVIANCGDGGLMMLLGDLRTAVTFELPAVFVVYDNGRLGMVRLEQEQGGLPEYGTVLDNPNLAEVASAMGLTSFRVTKAGDLRDTIQKALSSTGPVLVDVLTNPEEVSVPPELSVDQAWGFAIAKSKEFIESA